MNLNGLYHSICVAGVAVIMTFTANAQHTSTNIASLKPAFASQTRAPLADKSSQFIVSDFVDGLTRPWSMVFMPDGNMIVTEVPGRLRIISMDGSVSGPIAGMPAVRAYGSRGLNDIILDPDFANNRIIYFSYHAPLGDIQSDNSDDAYEKSNADRAQWNKLSRTEKAANPFGIWRISSARLSEDGKNIENVNNIIDVSASRMAFDESGKLLITTQRKSPMGKQDLTNPHGMIIRINKDGSLPGDNPKFAKDNVNPMAYVVGLRNSNGLALNLSSGEFWVADQGGNAGDEINIIKPGHDYGWPEVTYSTGPGEPLTQRDGVEQPIYYWSPVSMAPSSMMFYQGDKFPHWQGNLFLTGLSSQHISRLVLHGDRVVGEERLLDETNKRYRHISQGPDGIIYVIEDGNMAKILKISTPASQ